MRLNSAKVHIVKDIPLTPLILLSAPPGPRLLGIYQSTQANIVINVQLLFIKRRLHQGL